MQKAKGKRQKLFKQSGFTLIEILVVTVILGILLTVSANVFITILRNQNKTALVTEIRQNASVVLDTFERDVRSASGATVTPSPDTMVLTYPDNTTVIWVCVAPNPPFANGVITRQVGTAPTVALT